MAKSTILANQKEVFEEIIEKFDNFIFDCDGVIWRGESALQGAISVIDKLKQIGKKVFFVTNNNSKNRSEYLKKFNKLGFSNIKETDVFGTAYTSALWLKQNISSNGKVYVIGNKSMEQELQKIGVNYFGFGIDNEIKNQLISEIKEVKLEDDVEAVLVGMDCDFSLTKLTKAASFLRNPKCKFIVTNEDDRFPLPDSNHVIVCTGSLVASIECASGRIPDVVCGKPHSFMLDCFKLETDLNLSKSLMIGDNLNTDILFGNNNGMNTLLVLSGVTSKSDLDNVCKIKDQQNKVPSYYMDSLNSWTEFCN